MVNKNKVVQTSFVGDDIVVRTRLAVTRPMYDSNKKSNEGDDVDSKWVKIEAARIDRELMEFSDRLHRYSEQLYRMQRERENGR